MSETINILMTEYKLLKRDQRILNALYTAGVDNWEGYDEADFGEDSNG